MCACASPAMAAQLTAANRVAAEECCSRAEACLMEGDEITAVKHLKRAQRMNPFCVKYKAMLEALQPTAEQRENKTAGTDNQTTERGRNTERHVVDVPHEWTVQGGKLKSTSLSESETEDVETQKHEDSDELPAVDDDMPLEEMERQYWRYDTETGDWRPTNNNKTNDIEAKDDNPVDDNIDIQDVETLSCQQPFAGEIPDVVKSCEPHRSATRSHATTVRRVGGARIKSRKRNIETHGDTKPRKMAANRSTSMECETKSSKNGTEGSDGLTTESSWQDSDSVSSRESFAVAVDEIKERLNDWLQKAYENIVICLIWLIALLWTALVFTTKGLKWLSLCIFTLCQYILYRLTIYAMPLWHTHIKPRATTFRSNLESWWRRLWGKPQTESNPSSRDFAPTIKSDPGETIELPRTSDEAVERLLACRDKDLYSILGVARNSTGEEIKKHYKKQAMLVHPDKNKSPGTEEAFKILAQAFETLGNEEKRQQYDSMAERDSIRVDFEQFFEDLLQKMEEARSLMQCTQCGGTHKRYVVNDRSMCNARFCGMCYTMHPVNEGDVWCESRLLGFKVFFYACMDGDICDITEWAACQGLWNKVKANAHGVTLKISTPGNRRNKPRSRQQFDEQRDIEDMFRHLLGDSNQFGDPGQPDWSNDWMGGHSGHSDAHQSGKQRARAKKRRKRKA